MALSPLGIAIMQTQTQPAPARPGSVAPTDVLGAYQLSSNMAEQQYQAKLAQQNALWGGLAGLGSAGIIGGSKIPAVQKGIGNLFSPSSAASTNSTAGLVNAASPADYASLGLAPDGSALGSSVSDLAPGASSLGGWMSDPAFAGLAGGAADAGAFAPGAAVATDLAAAAPAAADAGTAAAAGGGLALADLLPFLFAA